MSGDTFWEMYASSPPASWLPGDGSVEALRAAHEADRHKFHAVVSPYGFFREAVLLAALDETAVKHEARVSELLAANNAEVERRRAAETEVESLNHDIARAIEAASAEAEHANTFSWQPIDTLPGSDAPLDLSGAGARGEREPLVLAKTADGRRMIWRPSILRAAMKEGTPADLGFPAIAWMFVPE